MGLFTSIINNQYSDKNGFWGKYEYLNEYNNGKTDQMIFNYQMTKLKTILGTSKKQFDATESFIFNSEFSLAQLQEFYESEQLNNKLYKTIMDIFNAPLKKSTAYKTQGTLDTEKLLRDIEQVRIELQSKGIVSLQTLNQVETWAKIV